MRSIGSVFGTRLISEVTLCRVAQHVTFGVALLTLVLGLWKLARLEMTEAQLFLGVLLVLTLTMVEVLAGLVLPLTARRKES